MKLSTFVDLLNVFFMFVELVNSSRLERTWMQQRRLNEQKLMSSVERVESGEGPPPPGEASPKSAVPPRSRL